MTDQVRVEVHHLSKRFDRVRAVDDLSFAVEPGSVPGGAKRFLSASQNKTLLAGVAPADPAGGSAIAWLAS